MPLQGWNFRYPKNCRNFEFEVLDKHIISRKNHIVIIELPEGITSFYGCVDVSMRTRKVVFKQGDYFTYWQKRPGWTVEEGEPYETDSSDSDCISL